MHIIYVYVHIYRNICHMLRKEMKIWRDIPDFYKLPYKQSVLLFLYDTILGTR